MQIKTSLRAGAPGPQAFLLNSPRPAEEPAGGEVFEAAQAAFVRAQAVVNDTVGHALSVMGCVYKIREYNLRASHPCLPLSGAKPADGNFQKGDNQNEDQVQTASRPPTDYHFAAYAVI